jgi:hypothetical protein
MKPNQILLLIALVVAVGIGGLVLNHKKSESWSGGTAAGEKLLAKLPVGEELAGITILKGTNTLTLEKKGDAWTVKERGGYPANFADLSSAIIKLRDLKPVQIEQVGASQLGRLELLPPGVGSNTATRVEFRDASGKVLETLLLGKTQMREDKQAAQFGGGEMGGFPVGRWVMVGEAKDKASLVADPLSNLAPNPSQWLSKDFLKVEKIKSIQVTHTDATNSWSVSRTNEAGSDWTLTDSKADEALDSSKTSGFGYALSSPTFNDVAFGVEPGSLGLDKPTTVVIGTFDGFTYTLKVGAKKDDSQALTVAVSANLAKERNAAADEKAEDKARLDREFAEHNKALSDKFATEKSYEKWAYLVSGWTLESLLKTRSELLQAKTTAASGTTATNAPPDFFTPPASP